MQTDSAQRSKSILITGQSGFVGTHLLKVLSTCERFSISQRQECDLLEPESISHMIGNDIPDAVIHLAGQTSVPAAIADPATTFQINLIGTLNLLQTLKQKGFSGVFLYISSGDVYGSVAETQLPIDEREPPKPRNPYAVSKIAAETLCLQWSRVEKWRIIIARPFNHIGEGQRPDFVISEIARQLIHIKQGRQAQPLMLGDIDVSRDFLAVEDVIDAYLALLDGGGNGEIYNVCSGTEYVVRDLANQMMELAGIDADIARDPTRFRPADQRRVIGNSDKLRTATGWQPRVNIRESLRAILHDWEMREQNV